MVLVVHDVPRDYCLIAFQRREIVSQLVYSDGKRMLFENILSRVLSSYPEKFQKQSKRSSLLFYHTITVLALLWFRVSINPPKTRSFVDTSSLYNPPSCITACIKTHVKKIFCNPKYSPMWSICEICENYWLQKFCDVWYAECFAFVCARMCCNAI